MVKTGVTFLMYIVSSQQVWALRKHCPEWAGTGTPRTFGVPAARGKLSPSQVVYKPVVQVGYKFGGGNAQKPCSAGKSESLFKLRKGSSSGEALLGMRR